VVAHFDKDGDKHVSARHWLMSWGDVLFISSAYMQWCFQLVSRLSIQQLTITVCRIRSCARYRSASTSS
jgi:hypothetical protein